MYSSNASLHCIVWGVKWFTWCIVVLLLACDKRGRKASAEVAKARDTAELSAEAKSANALASGSATAPAQREFKLDCRDFGPDVPIVDEKPGPGVPRIAASNVGQGASGERYAMGDASWSPDSRHLVFALAYCGQGFVDCRSQIVAVDSAKPNPQFVFLANGSRPAWSR